MEEIESNHIRPVTLEDIPYLTRLGGELGYEINPQSLETRLKEILSIPDHALWAAEIQTGEVVGWVHTYLVWTVESEQYAEIGGLVVNARFRKMGIGKALMTMVEYWIKSKGIKAIRLRSGASREEAHRFYEAIGYKNMKTQYTFYKEL